MGLIRKNKSESVVLKNVEKSKKLTLRKFDYVFCTGIALLLGYTLATYKII
jgi:hypothetical protein